MKRNESQVYLLAGKSETFKTPYSLRNILVIALFGNGGLVTDRFACGPLLWRWERDSNP